MENPINVAQHYLTILNQIFDIEKKIQRLKEPNSIQRNINSLYDLFENNIGANQKIVVIDPFGEKYDETRTDCEASIAGDNTDDLRIVEVIKPIIRVHIDNTPFTVQKGIVIVESKNN